MNRMPESDDELLGRIRQGDEQAFLNIYRRRQGAIFRFAAQVTGSVAAAEDITQEVFLTLLRGECGYNPDRGTLSGYLFGIARKLALRQLDGGRGNVTIEADSGESVAHQLANYEDPLRDLTRREGIDALRRAVKALPRRYREVVVLCDLEEVDYADAAEALGCPIGTVRSRLHRARALLLEKLNQEQPRAAMGAWKPLRCGI